MKKHVSFVILNSVLCLMSASAGIDCIALSLSVKNATAAEQSRVLEIVSEEVAAAPTCACEIVKAAIEGVSANPKTVAAIVQSASIAAPEQMRLVSQCAVAVAPDALTEVQMVLALMDPNLGDSDHSAKSAKGEKAPAGEVAAIPNPLDFPGQGPIGPTPGSTGGLGIFPFSPPPGAVGSGGVAFLPPPGSVGNKPPGSGGVGNPPPVTNPNPPSQVPVGPPSQVPVGPPSQVPVGPPSEVPVGSPSVLTTGFQPD